MLWTRLKCKDWKSIVYCTSHCVYLYPQVEEFFFLLLRAAVFRRAPKQHSIEKVVAAKLHFTDNNLAASIYLDARTNTHTKKIHTWETTNRKPRIGLLFTLYALDTVQDFLIKLGIKPRLHILKVSIFSLNHVIVRLTKIMNNLLGHLKTFTLKVSFLC